MHRDLIYIDRGVLKEEGHWDMSPLGAEGALLPWSPPRMEKLVSGYCALKKVNGKFSWTVFLRKANSRKRSTKIALGTGGALSTVRALGLVAPLTIF